MDPQLPVDSRALDASEDAKVGGEPRWICQREEVRHESAVRQQETEVSPDQAAEHGDLNKSILPVI